MQRQVNHILSRLSRSATIQRVRMYTTPGTEQRKFWDDISPFVNAVPGVRVGAGAWYLQGLPTYLSSPNHNDTGLGGITSSSSPYHMSHQPG